MNKFPIVTEFASAEVPQFLEKKNQNLVYFGVDNLYPFELIDLYNDSSTHNAIVNGKVGYIVGNGLEGGCIESMKWLSQANIDEDWTSLTKRLTLDYELFNGYAIEVIRTKVGNQYHHLDFANIRLGLDGSIKYADDWITEKGTRNSKPTIQYLDRYNPRDPEQKRGVIYHVDYRPNLKYYPLPVYVGSLAEIKTDVQIGDYWLNEVKNGFVGGTLIQHNNGVPETKEEAEKFEKAFQEKFGKATGTKIVHLFSPTKENGSEITNLNGNDLHNRYIEMSNRVKESIFIGHRVTNPILFGVKEEGQLGARNELDLAYEIFTNTYIAERQNTLLRTIKKLAFYEIQKTDIDIVPLKPIDTVDLTSDIILANMTREEIRGMIEEQTGIDLVEESDKVEEVTSNPITPEAVNEPTVEKIEEVDEEKEQKEASYNGAQIASALAIVEQVKNNVLSPSQGKAFLMEFLRLSDSAASKLLSEGFSIAERFNNKKEFVEPRSGEKHYPFMSRCISKLVGEEGYKADQASAICHTSWENIHGPTEMVEIEGNDKEMVDGIVELLLKVEDLDNRKSMILSTLKDFALQGVVFDLDEFLNRLGLSISDFNSKDFNAITKFDTYNDYPKAASRNAKAALNWAEKNGWGSCGTAVGKKRANQLANGDNISRDTIARMAAFERHRQNSNKKLGDGCGRLMWLAWGGDEGIAWAQRKLKQIDSEKMSACTCFSNDEDISHLFDNIGESEDNYEVIDSFNIDYDKNGSPIEFATKEQGIIQRVLKVVLTNPLIKATGISELLGLNFDELLGSINILSTSDLIEIEGTDIGLTDKGERVAKAIDVPEFEVRYKYELRADAPPLKEGGRSRDFCRKMVAKKKLYTKKEIDVLRNDMKSSPIADITDVWLARGGWYRRPNTEVSIPYCRHQWKQKIVRKKK